MIRIVESQPQKPQPKQPSRARKFYCASKVGLGIGQNVAETVAGAIPGEGQALVFTQTNRKWTRCFSRRVYRERNLIERILSKLKHFRRVATRYDKLAENFLAMVQLASTRLWLRTHENTA